MEKAISEKRKIDPCNLVVVATNGQFDATWCDDLTGAGYIITFLDFDRIPRRKFRTILSKAAGVLFVGHSHNIQRTVGAIRSILKIAKSLKNSPWFLCVCSKRSRHGFMQLLLSERRVLIEQRPDKGVIDFDVILKHWLGTVAGASIPVNNTV